MVKPIWVRDAVVRAIQKRQLAEHGRAEGIRDENILVSALAQPRNSFAYSDPKPYAAALAAAYVHGLAGNHPFVDGNKRVAYVVCRTFLRLNGRDLTASPHDKYLTFLLLAKGELSQEDLNKWIRRRMNDDGP